MSRENQLELVDRMASVAETATGTTDRDTNIVVPQVFVEGNYLGVSDEHNLEQSISTQRSV